MNRTSSQLDLVRADDLHSTEEEFRRQHPLIWGATLFGPPVLTVLILIAIVIFAGWQFTQRVIAYAAIALFVMGRFIILGGKDGSFFDTTGPLHSVQLFGIVTYLDLMTALVLAFHIGFLFKLPYIGKRIVALVTDGHFILDKQPWMRRATFFGLIAFVGFPLAATGSIGGSIFGRLLGMSRLATFCGIFIGTLIGNGTMFLFSDLMNKYVDKDNIYLKIGGFAVIVTLVVILERRYRKLRDDYAAGTELVTESDAMMQSGVAVPPADKPVDTV